MGILKNVMSLAKLKVIPTRYYKKVKLPTGKTFEQKKLS